MNDLSEGGLDGELRVYARYECVRDLFGEVKQAHGEVRAALTLDCI